MAHVIWSKGSFSEFMPAKDSVYSSEDLRCIYFYLKKGQKIDLHTSPHLVWITVLEGKSRFFIGSEENTQDLCEKESILYEPREPHGFSALEDCVLMALIIKKA